MKTSSSVGIPSFTSASVAPCPARTPAAGATRSGASSVTYRRTRRSPFAAAGGPSAASACDPLGPLDAGQRPELGDDPLGDLGVARLRGQLERGAARDGAHQRLGGVEGEELAVIHDPDAIRERRRLVHVVRGQDERHALVAKLAEAVPDEELRRRVEPGGGLVEEEHLRRVHQRPRDHHPLRLAAREQVGLLVGPVEQAELLEQLVCPPAPALREGRRGRRRGR